MHTPTDGRAEPSQAAPAIAEAARAAGATILTDCAVRGIETQGGRVSGVVTEKGASPATPWCSPAAPGRGCSAAMPAIDLPQLRVLGSVFRTAPLSGGPEITAGGSVFAFRKRLDGGYTIARRNANVGRHHARFVPAAAALPADAASTTTARSACAFGRRFFEEWRTRRRWSLDEATPFEAVRVLDPAPKQATLDEARAGAVTQLSRRSRGCRWRRAGAG